MWYNMANMKAVVFIIIVLGIVFGYALIDEVAKNGGLSNAFGFERKVETKESAPTKTYYSSANQTTTPTTSNTFPNYVGRVEIRSIKKASENNPSLIRLIVKPFKGEPINLTGWSIKTRKGTFTIPKGLEIYQKNGSSRNIIIGESLTVYLIGDVEPFRTRKNFRSNRCLGYLSKSDNIYPGVRSYCQAPKLENLEGFTPYCKDYLIKQRKCEMPNYSDEFKISTDSKCVSYILEYYTYNGCLKRSSKNDDFLLNYWYIYVNKNIVEPLHDTIYLYDRNNNLVDKYTY